VHERTGNHGTARADELARLEQRAVVTLTELNRVLSVAQGNLR
jgi:hypothetical protein